MCLKLNSPPPFTSNRLCPYLPHHHQTNHSRGYMAVLTHFYPSPPIHQQTKGDDIMNKLIDKARGAGWFPVTDNKWVPLQLPCPFCQAQMLIFRGQNVQMRRLFACTCGYRRWVAEEQFEEVSGLCRICGKKGCSADDHVLHGTLIGMGF